MLTRRCCCGGGNCTFPCSTCGGIFLFPDYSFTDANGTQYGEYFGPFALDVDKVVFTDQCGSGGGCSGIVGRTATIYYHYTFECSGDNIIISLFIDNSAIANCYDGFNNINGYLLFEGSGCTTVLRSLFTQTITPMCVDGVMTATATFPPYLGVDMPATSVDFTANYTTSSDTCFSICFHTFDCITGLVLPGVRIEIMVEGHLKGTCVTGDDGKCCIEVSHAAFFQIRATKDGYAAGGYGIGFDGVHRLDADIYLSNDVSHQVIVNVISGCGGGIYPLPDALVVLDGVAQTTDINGQAKFTVSKHGTILLTISHCRYIDVNQTVEVFQCSNHEFSFTIGYDSDNYACCDGAVISKTIHVSDSCGGQTLTYDGFGNWVPSNCLSAPGMVDSINDPVGLTACSGTQVSGSIPYFYTAICSGRELDFAINSTGRFDPATGNWEYRSGACVTGPPVDIRPGCNPTQGLTGQSGGSNPLAQFRCSYFGKFIWPDPMGANLPHPCGLGTVVVWSE